MMIAPIATHGKCQTGIPALLLRKRRQQPSAATYSLPNPVHRQFHRIVKEIIILPEFGPVVVNLA